MQDVNATDQSVTIDIPVELAISATPEVIPNESTETPQPQLEVKTEELSTNAAPTETPTESIPADSSEIIEQKEPVETKPKHAGGRPCEYCQRKDEIMRIANAYLDKCKKGVNGKPIMPYKEELAMELNIIDETLANWSKKTKEDGSLEHPEFFDLWSMLNMIQKLRLQQRTMGRYNPTGAIALLKWHHGMMETSKQIHAGDPNEPLEIIITEVVNQNAEEN